jgi:hypothetical protein
VPFTVIAPRRSIGDGKIHVGRRLGRLPRALLL